MKKPASRKKVLLRITALVSLLALVFLVVVFPQLFPESPDDILSIKDSMVRVSLGLLLFVILGELGHSRFFRMDHFGKSFVMIIPALIISINNFPLSAFFAGRASLTQPPVRAVLFLLECLSIGFFEEIVFRGIVLLLMIQTFEKEKSGLFSAILLSSLLFGFSHLTNLFGGAAIGSTILQMGYSFLVGMMWSVMFLKTKNLWLVMFLHATYNFFGMILFEMGTVNGRYDLLTIVATVVLSLLAAGYSFYLFRTLDRVDKAVPN